MTNNPVIKWIMFILSFVVLYRYRYRLLNMALGNMILRTLAVRFMMNIPAFRDRVMGSVFRP